MFAQQDIYSEFMDRFFAENSHPSVSWIHDLGKCRYELASRTLFEEAQNAYSLQSKHVNLNLALSTVVSSRLIAANAQHWKAGTSGSEA